MGAPFLTKKKKKFRFTLTMKEPRDISDPKKKRFWFSLSITHFHGYYKKDSVQMTKKKFRFKLTMKELTEKYIRRPKKRLVFRLSITHFRRYYVKDNVLMAI